MFHVEHSERLARLLHDGAAEIGLSLSDQEISAFLVYIGALKKWNQKINLTALRSEKEIVVKHFLDSLFGCKAVDIPQDASMLDIGSGAGFPGLPLKIVMPTTQLTLLEPSHKKTAFLRYLVGLLGVDRVATVAEKIQQLSGSPLYSGPYRCVFSRALNIRDVLPFVSRILAKDGLLLLWRSRALKPTETVPDLKVLKEVAYELPMGFGRRILAVLAIK
jgi:16S rRNA (guanine527-N7)-methyltransferase